jgi:predicted DNA-binding transcriptional regulator AlpA
MAKKVDSPEVKSRNLKTLSVNEVMARTGWPRSMVYRLMHHKEIATIRLGTRGNFHVLESSLEAFFDRHTVGGEKAGRRRVSPSEQALQDAVDAACIPPGTVNVFD